MLGGVDVRRTQVGRQQPVPAEHVQRQETVLVVVAVKESSHLVAVDRIIRGIEVQDQLRRRRGVRGNEVLHQHFGHRHQHRPGDAVLQPAQGWRAGQGQVFSDAPLGGQLHQRVFPQTLMVVQVFIAQRDAVDSLAEHRQLLVHDQVLVTGIGNDNIQLRRQTQPPVGLPQQQCPRVTGQAPAVKSSLYASSSMTGE